METYLRRISALNDATRVLILRFLARYGACCVCELHHSFDMGQPRLSRHLKILREAGLVAAHRQGTKVFYELAPEDDQAKELLATLDQVQTPLPRKIDIEQIRRMKKTKEAA